MHENAAINFSKILDQAKRELGYRDHIATGNLAPHARTQRIAATGGYMDLRELSVPALLDTNGRVRSLVGQAGTSGNSETLAASLIASSLVAKAGARIIVAAERPAPSNNVGAMYADAGEFVLVEPAQFAAVDDGDDATASTLPFTGAPIVWDDAPSCAFSTTITRRKQKDTAGYDLEATLMRSIVLGLAREADRVLLAAIAAKTPTAFTLAKAAARGLEFAELRALMGTAGTGGTVSQDGELRVSGVRAEMTNQAAGTIVGSFARSAVAVHPMINVIAERLNVNGDTKITVFANMLGLVPDATAFWSVSA